MQRQYARLRSGVIRQASTAKITRHTGNADNVALLRLQHGGQELLDRDPVAEQVDAENLLKKLLRCVENGMCSSDACVVD